MKMGEGESCQKERRIQVASVCKEAAEELGLSWSNTSLVSSSSLGCAANGRDKVFFNVQTNSSGSSGNYAEICKG